MLELLSASVISLVVLSFVIFFHELGHFLTGRWNKVKIEVFSIGFGPELFGFWDRHQTRWKVSAIPLGGYVKFLRDFDISGDSTGTGALDRKALWQRAMIIAAGPISNLILAIFVLTIKFMIYGETKVPPIVDTVLYQSAAQDAGIQSGDRIIQVDGHPIDSFSDILNITSVSSDKDLMFKLLRDGKVVSILLTPRMMERIDSLGNKYNVSLIGISVNTSLHASETIQYGFLSATKRSFIEVFLLLYRTYNFLCELVEGKQRLSDFRGPIGIGQLTSQVVMKFELSQILTLIAFISVNIGVFNLLPIPMLDGGYLFFYLIEAIQGQALNIKTQEVALKIGLIVLGAFTLFCTFNDFIRIIGNSS
ncbi:M50 family metallopeptidase [Candidatus Endowatersipora endosymbiont of Watersipora subatra]|uniref:M50 family metallopeptidase n=1 Tax=Candidatus Endowatersipora endosymbiont of Watersipora subatra TaxID=3077946 RepID=UPI00312C9171